MNPNPMAEGVGPVYDESVVLNITGWDRVRLAAEVQAGRAIAVTTSDGVTVWPVFQFTDGAVDPSVVEVLDIFRTVEPSWWTVASWFMSPNKPGLDDTSPIDWINANHDMTLYSVSPTKPPAGGLPDQTHCRCRGDARFHPVSMGWAGV